MSHGRDTADLIARNGRIRTFTPHHPWAHALAVRDGRVAALDGAAAGMQGPETRVVDLAGRFAMPGLFDVHNHHSYAGQLDLFECAFPESASRDDILDAVRAWARQTPEGTWITGGTWGSGLLADLSSLDTLRALDAASGGRPVMLRDDSHHNRWVNSRAMELAGIATDAPATQPGVVGDPTTGVPLGVLLEPAGLRVERARAADAGDTLARDARSSARGIEILHSHGVTAFQDAAVSLSVLRALKHLDDRGELKAWVVSSMQLNDLIFGTDPVGEELIAHGRTTRGRHHRPDFVKIFLDGVPPSKTAAFLEPYLPDPTNGEEWCGDTTLTPSELVAWLRATAELGLSAKIHGVGDASVRRTLDAVATVRAEGGSGGVRYHIAHGEWVHPDDLPRFAELDVVADLSPPLWFPCGLVEAMPACLPSDRAARMCPNRDLLDNGALLAGGSDWPVSPSPNPWTAIQGLVTREDPTGEFPGALWPEQALDLEQALAVYTVNAARATGLDDVAGSLEVGKSADFVRLDRDPYETAARDLGATRVLQTYFEGEKVYDGGA